MSRETSIDEQVIVRRVSETDPVPLSWGELVWLVGENETPGAEQTLGVVTIEAGKRNPLHSHPNCEELLYVVSGQAEHKLGDEMFHIEAGDVIRIPRGVPHWAKASADAPLKAVISFSAADRRTESHEGTDDEA